MSDVSGSSDLPSPPSPPSPPSTPRPSASPGWHPDPLGRYDHRWYDGSSWTDQVSTNGVPTTDPHGLAPAAPGGFAPGRGTPTGKNGMAVAALVCGIIAVLIAWIPFIVVGGIVLAALALTFGIIGLRRSNEVGRGRGQAITGIVTGGIAMALAVVGIVLSVIFWRELSDFIEPGPNDVTATSCEIENGLATTTGTLTNESDEVRDYTLFVDVDDELEAITLDGVGAGETVEWRTAVRVSADDGSCTPDLTVNGPFPFGIELDPVD